MAAEAVRASFVVTDTGNKRVVVFDENHKVEGTIAEGLVAPGGLAVDNDNRLLYVTDAEQDLVLVSGSGTTYNVAVSGMTGNGTVIASLAAGVAQTGTGNLNTASTSTDNTVTFTGFNQSPTDIQWNGVTPANSTLPSAGATIANLSTVDPDSVSWTYSLEAGSSANFAVSATGAVTRTGSAMAINQTYTVIVKSDDGGGTGFSRFHDGFYRSIFSFSIILSNKDDNDRGHDTNQTSSS